MSTARGQPSDPIKVENSVSVHCLTAFAKPVGAEMKKHDLSETDVTSSKVPCFWILDPKQRCLAKERCYRSNYTTRKYMKYV